MRTYLCCLVLCFFCCRFYYLYRKYENEYLNEKDFRDRYFRIKGDAEKFKLVQRCITALRHSHPETVEISSRAYGPEIYRTWVGTPPSNWRTFSYYFMYRDGIIIDSPEEIGKETTIWPKNKEHLRQFFDDDADIPWCYIEIYRTLIEKGRKSHSQDFNNRKSYDADGGLSQYRILGDTSSVTWLNAQNKPILTRKGYLFTENVYEDWKRKADTGYFIHKGVHSSADLDRWLKSIGLYPVEQQREM